MRDYYRYFKFAYFKVNMCTCHCSMPQDVVWFDVKYLSSSSIKIGSSVADDQINMCTWLWCRILRLQWILHLISAKSVNRSLRECSVLYRQMCGDGWHWQSVYTDLGCKFLAWCASTCAKKPQTHRGKDGEMRPSKQLTRAHYRGKWQWNWWQ